MKLLYLTFQEDVPLYLGVKAVLAKSFARIHAANLINAGIIPLTFANEDDYEHISQGDELVLSDIKNDIESKDTTDIFNKTTGRSITLNLNLSKRQRDILVAGGLLNYTKGD